MEVKDLVENIIRLEQAVKLVTAQRDALLNSKQSRNEEDKNEDTEAFNGPSLSDCADNVHDALALANAERDTLRQRLNEANSVIVGLCTKFLATGSTLDEESVDKLAAARQYMPVVEEKETAMPTNDSGSVSSDGDSGQSEGQAMQGARRSMADSESSADTLADTDELSCLAAGKAELAIRVADLESQKDALETRLTACMAENTVLRARLAVAAAKKRTAARNAASFDASDTQLYAKVDSLPVTQPQVMAANFAAMADASMAVNPFAGVTKTSKLAVSDPFNPEPAKHEVGARVLQHSSSSLNSRKQTDEPGEEEAASGNWEIQAAMLSPGLDRMSSFDSQSEVGSPSSVEKLQVDDDQQPLLPVDNRRKTSENEAMAATLMDIQRRLSKKDSDIQRRLSKKDSMGDKPAISHHKSSSQASGDSGAMDVVHLAAQDQDQLNQLPLTTFISCAASKADLDAELEGLRKHSEVLQNDMDHADSLMSDVVQQLKKVSSRVNSL